MIFTSSDTIYTLSSDIDARATGRKAQSWFSQFMTLMQGFVALMGIYTVCAVACCLWSRLKGPTVAPRAPSRMLVSTPTTALPTHALMTTVQAAVAVLAEVCVSVKEAQVALAADVASHA